MWRKRWLRRTVYGVFALVVIPFVAFCVRREIIFTANEAELNEAVAEADRLDPHWRWEDLEARRTPVPDDQNAVQHIRNVKRLVDKNVRWPAAPPGPWPTAEAPNRELSTADRGGLAELLTKHAGAVEAARDVARFSRGQFTMRLADNPLDTKMADQADWPIVHFLLGADVERDLHDGKASEAFAKVRAMLANVHAFADEPTLVTQMIRARLTSHAVGKLERVLAMGEAGDEIRQLLAPLGAWADEPTLYHGLRGERAMCVKLFDHLDRGLVRLNELNRHGGPTDPMSQLGWWMFRARLPADKAKYLRVMTELIENTKQPFHEQAAFFAAVVPSELDSTNYPITRLLFPAADRVCRAAMGKRAQLLTARLGLAVEHFRTSTGHWPESMAALPADVLLATAADPYDGKPIRYRRTDYGAVVYAVGPDGVDNGGAVEDPQAPDKSPDVGFRLWDPVKRRLPPLSAAQSAGRGTAAALGLGPRVARSADDRPTERLP